MLTCTTRKGARNQPGTCITCPLPAHRAPHVWQARVCAQRAYAYRGHMPACGCFMLQATRQRALCGTRAAPAQLQLRLPSERTDPPRSMLHHSRNMPHLRRYMHMCVCAVLAGHTTTKQVCLSDTCKGAYRPTHPCAAHGMPGLRLARRAGQGPSPRGAAWRARRHRRASMTAGKWTCGAACCPGPGLWPPPSALVVVVGGAPAAAAAAAGLPPRWWLRAAHPCWVCPCAGRCQRRPHCSAAAAHRRPLCGAGGWAWKGWRGCCWLRRSRLLPELPCWGLPSLALRQQQRNGQGLADVWAAASPPGACKRRMEQIARHAKVMSCFGRLELRQQWAQLPVPPCPCPCHYV